MSTSGSGNVAYISCIPYSFSLFLVFPPFHSILLVGRVQHKNTIMQSLKHVVAVTQEYSITNNLTVGNKGNSTKVVQWFKHT